MADHSTNATPITELPDSFFDVTADDCVAMQRDLQQQVKKLTDAPLTTLSLRQATLYERYSQYNKVIMTCNGLVTTHASRLLCVYNSQIIGCYKDHSNPMSHVSSVLHYIILHNYYIVRALVKFVREHLADPAVKFYLCKLCCNLIG